jgi:NAD(P)-dependent dehydrogenase (short-subunit alcohol dehydrogenase family)
VGKRDPNRGEDEPLGAGLLRGSVMVVAGIGPGMGGHIARLAVGAGAAVVLGARSVEFGERLAAELVDAGGRAMFRRCDVTSTSDCDELAACAVDHFGGIDCVVANAMAGGPPGATLVDGDIDDWREAYDVNVFGSLRVVKSAVPALGKSDNASVVFIGSQIVRRVFAGRGPYASSKAALLTAAHVLAAELGPLGIRVNTLVPGRMWGPSLERGLPRLAAERGTTEAEQFAQWEAATALRRVATDEECARVVLFLASRLASAVTGQSIDVNAGETMR